MSNINKNDLSNALCDIQDIKKMSELIWVSDGLGGRCQYKDLPKDNDGSEITIGDCIDDVLNFLEGVENNA
jgi:hypothetical protein|tara:strand:+ start:1596 stop:1808 length:213 start_codon:yes stop_codon:yes gene_type:complete